MNHLEKINISLKKYEFINVNFKKVCDIYQKIMQNVKIIDKRNSLSGKKDEFNIKSESLY